MQRYFREEDFCCGREKNPYDKYEKQRGGLNAPAGFAPAVVYGVVLADKNGKSALYSYSERKVVESANEDGSISKNAVFEHKGFFYY